MAVTVKRQVAIFMILLLCCAATMAQAPAQPPRKTAPASRVSTQDKQNAPQVVTIVHRLNGLKMFRLLARSEQQAQAISSLDTEFKLSEDVHTNIIAGVAMDDGETIAAWLPEAAIELGFSGFRSSPDFAFGAFEPPDVTVIGSEGKQLLAKYVGLDGVTGLSILTLVDKNPAAARTTQDKPVDVGENVRLFGPEPVTGHRGYFNSNLYVRIAATQGRVFDVRRAPSGGIARFKVSSARLTQAMVGGVAITDAGETLGIVNSLEGEEASIIPVATIRRAAKRVLERQASVPRPYLGVKGEAVSAMKIDQILNHGWKPQRAEALAYDHRGILVTGIVPDSPAADAALRVGDVILKVNDKEIENSDDFSWWLEQAGPSSLVSFTVARPDRAFEEALHVKLSGAFDPGRSFRSRFARRSAQGFARLFDQGIETITLRAAVAMQLGMTAGLLVVYVEPSTPAFEAGLQPGDVIQSINGQAVSRLAFSFTNTEPSMFTFEIFRNKQKRTVTVPVPPVEKKP
jgi:S1-C subfamily serine protease